MKIILLFILIGVNYIGFNILNFYNKGLDTWYPVVIIVADLIFLYYIFIHKKNKDKKSLFLPSVVIFFPITGIFMFIIFAMGMSCGWGVEFPYTSVHFYLLTGVYFLSLILLPILIKKIRK